MAATVGLSGMAKSRKSRSEAGNSLATPSSGVAPICGAARVSVVALRVRRRVLVSCMVGWWLFGWSKECIWVRLYLLVQVSMGRKGHTLSIWKLDKEIWYKDRCGW